MALLMQFHDAVMRARHRVPLAHPSLDGSTYFRTEGEMGDVDVPVPNYLPIPFDPMLPKRVLAIHGSALTETTQAELRDDGYWLQGGPAWLVFIRHVQTAEGPAEEQACAVHVGDLQPPILRMLADGGFTITDSAPYTIWARNVTLTEEEETPAS